MKPLLSLVAAVVLQAVTTALLGLSFSVADSVVMLTIGAGSAAAVGALWLRRRPELKPPPVVRLSVRGALVRLNVWSAICFGAFFLGIVVHEAPIVFALEVGFAPLAATVWSWHQGGRSAPAPRQWVGAGVMAVLSLAMAGIAQLSNPASLAGVLLGWGLGVVAGVAVAALAITSRSLGAQGISFPYVIANRFHATYVGAAVVLAALLAAGQLSISATRLAIIAAFAVAAMVIPLILLQFAMLKLNPLSVTAALAAVPAATALLTALAGGGVSWHVTALAVLIVPVSLWLAARSASTRAASPQPASPQPASPATPGMSRVSVTQGVSS